MNARNILLALACALSALTAHAQLIENGGFETGDFTGWDDAGTVEIKTGNPGSAFVHSGSYGATLGSGILSQAFLTTPGEVYKVEFLLNTLPLPNDVGLLEVTWGNFDIPGNLDLGTVELLHSFNNPDPIPGSGWYKYTYDVLALGNVSSLKFEFQTQAVTYPNNAALDGVKVTNLPDSFTLPPLNGVPIGEPSPELVFGRPYVLDSSVTFAPVPEPSTYAAFAALGLLAFIARSRFKAAARARA